MRHGDRLGPYRIVGQIGEGGMGAVFVGEHALIGRRAAIKTLLPSLSARRDVVERFFDEARATTAISDPGVVQTFDFGFTDDGTAYLVMELLDGESLEARVRRLGRLTVVDALRIARQAAGSLGAVHACGIVHRDLKPENIFLVPDPEAQGGERPKILDFGIAKLGGDRGAAKTVTGVLMGTPLYMSPEQCRGVGAVDLRADVYALGCVLFHALTGTPPFDGEGAGEVLAAHLREAPRAPSALRPGLPPVVDAIVLRCLAKSPDDRFPTMGALQAAIEAALAHITGGATISIDPAPGPAIAAADRRTTLGSAAAEAVAPAERRRGAWIAIAIGAVTIIAVSFAARSATHRDRTVDRTSAPAASPPAPVAVDAAPAPDVIAPPVDAAPAPAPAPADAAPAPPDAPPPRPHHRRPPHPQTLEDIYGDR